MFSYPLPSDSQTSLSNQKIRTPSSSHFQTSLPLQLTLYFGVLYTTLMAITFPPVIYYKLHFEISDSLVYLHASLAILHVLILEPFRYYLGYRGNLRENVPDLFLFLILTVFPALVLAVAMIALPGLLSDTKCGGRACIQPVERAMFLLDAPLVVLQLFFGIGGLRRLIAKNTQEFYLKEGLVGHGSNSGTFRGVG